MNARGIILAEHCGSFLGFLRPKGLMRRSWMESRRMRAGRVREADRALQLCPIGGIDVFLCRPDRMPAMARSGKVRHIEGGNLHTVFINPTPAFRKTGPSSSRVFCIRSTGISINSGDAGRTGDPRAGRLRIML